MKILKLLLFLIGFKFDLFTCIHNYRNRTLLFLYNFMKIFIVEVRVKWDLNLINLFKLNWISIYHSLVDSLFKLFYCPLRMKCIYFRFRLYWSVLIRELSVTFLYTIEMVLWQSFLLVSTLTLEQRSRMYSAIER